jgi:hypothetical protein
MIKHIPLLSRGLSASTDDNVLIEKENVFIMDNHRLALWCWLQKIEKKSRYNILHIDAHPDLSESALNKFQGDLWSLPLKEYREIKDESINEKLFRWDNYLKVFLKECSQNVGETFSATHLLGSTKTLQTEIKSFELLKFMNQTFYEKNYINDLKWIVNLDLDYFFSAAPEKTQLFGDEYIGLLAKAINQGLENSMIKVLTISLSPECCGSWEKAEFILKKFEYEL